LPRIGHSTTLDLVTRITGWCGVIPASNQRGVLG